MPKNQAPISTIDPVAYGEKLWQRMASLFEGDHPEKDQPASPAKKSEHSMSVAERYASLDKSIYAKIQTLNAERKAFRKFSKETLAQALNALKARHAALDIPTVDGEGNKLTAKFENDRYLVVAKDASVEAVATIEALLDMLARATDEELLEESLKKSRNGQIRMIANSDARKFASGDTIEGGNEHYRGHGYASSLLFDEQGIMLGILKLSARCTRAMDRNEKKDSGDIYAVLVGDLPFRKDEDGNPISFLSLSPDVADLLIKGRSYHRIAEALGKKARELDKQLKEQSQEKAGRNALRSEVLKEAKDRVEEVGETAEPTAEPTPAEVESVEAAEVTA